MLCLNRCLLPGCHKLQMQTQKGEHSAAEALRNPLILHQIFKFFKTGFLLSSCSLVDATWNREARSFIRDNRECTAKFRKETCLCSFISGLNELCESTRKCNRIVPLNKLKIDMEFELDDIPPNYPHFMKETHLTSSLHLKYLNIFDCATPNNVFPCVKPVLLNLLWHSAAELRVLQLNEFNFLERTYGPGTFHFPKLDEFYMNLTNPSQHPGAFRTPNFIRMRKSVRKIMEHAPKLARIRTRGPWSVEMIPPEMYRLLYELQFRMEEAEGLILYRKILTERPMLRKLGIVCGHIVLDGNDLESRYYCVLESLLQTYAQSLQTIEIETTKPFPQLSYPPLVNVTSFKLTLRNSTFERLREFINSFGFRRSMPALPTVCIQMVVGSFVRDMYRSRQLLLMAVKPSGTDEHSLDSQNGTTVESTRLSTTEGLYVIQHVSECEMTLQLKLEGTGFNE